MALLINTRAVAKAYGVAPLFTNLSLSIEDGDRLGVIGPNGSGKSTLLEILAGRREPDSGEVVKRSDTRLAYVPQDSQFAPGETIRSVIEHALDRAKVPEADRAGLSAETLGRAGFENFDLEAASLSGGWRKRLAIAEALVQAPAILLLDEPTNHLDLAGIQWLEKLLTERLIRLRDGKPRSLLPRKRPTAMAELNRVYPDGLLLRERKLQRVFGEEDASSCTPSPSSRRRSKTACGSSSNGCAAVPKRAPTKAKARIDQAQES